MPPPPPSGNQSDNSAAILWIIIAIFVAGLAIWYACKPYLVTGYLTVKLYEVHYLNKIVGNRFSELYEVILGALANPAGLDPKLMLTVGEMVGKIYRLPMSVLFFLLALITYFGNVAHSFKSSYSMHSLMKKEKVNWPHISPVIGLNLIKQDIDRGCWAMAMTPMQFCKKHHLLQEVRPQRQPGMLRKEWDKVEVLLHRGLANQLFVLQLGPLWTGIKNAPSYAQALFAVFTARINGDTESATRLLRQLAISATSTLNFKNVTSLCRKYIGTKAVQKIIASHAYFYTVMASLLEKAREDGVQASADFLWLKPLDRQLWYVLNTVGRQTPCVEVAGAFAHWVSEKEAGIKLVVPMVEAATNALEMALKEVIYKPEEST